MTAAESRPEPLRVPVADVVIRTSLVGAQRQSRDSLAPAVIVVQRPVRIISDPPMAPEMVALEGVLGAAPANTPGHTALHVRSGMVDLDDPLELDEEELESEDGDEEELDVSVPPPAPPEALRRVPTFPSLAPVRMEPSPLSEPPVEVEVELDAQAERAPDAPERVSSPGKSPRPPPPGRPATLPDAPDLHTLARTTARISEIRPTKPRSHAWWEVFFDDDYLRTVRTPTRQQIGRQCDFIERRLGLKPGASVLDVGCGLGQHVCELSARGYEAFGIDLSLAMLARAAEEAQARSMHINFLHQDMRELTFEARFDAVTCLGTSLGYFDDETNKKVIEKLLRALKPGGALLLDVVNRDHVIRAQPNLIWFEGDGCVCMEESEFNYFTSRLQVKRTVILENGRQLESEYSLRLYSLHEIGQLMNASGFRVSEVSGREALPGVFFGQESPNLMIVAERRPDAGGGSDDRP